MMKKYRQKYGTGIYEFYNLTLDGFFRYKNKVIKHNIKTLIKWNKEFNNFYPKKIKLRLIKVMKCLNWDIYNIILKLWHKI